MHKQPAIISSLPKGIVGASIAFVKYGVLFELTQLGIRAARLRALLHPAYLPSGEVTYENGPFGCDRYVFADLGKVLQLGNNHVVDVGTTVPSAIHALRLQMLEAYYNFEMNGAIEPHPEWPDTYVVHYRGKRCGIAEESPLVRESELPLRPECTFVSKGAKVRWFCRHYDELKGIFE